MVNVFTLAVDAFAVVQITGTLTGAALGAFASGFLLLVFFFVGSWLIHVGHDYFLPQ